MKNNITSAQICRKTKIRRSQLEYLIREYPEFPVMRNGNGRQRQYPPEAIKFIRKWQKGNTKKSNRQMR
ncbi:MerR family transcriptional regulator [candidate division KSB1 bacterium]|nr:MerR family transcriptional regulator [candidate division KSB1 bacterium]